MSARVSRTQRTIDTTVIARPMPNTIQLSTTPTSATVVPAPR